MALNTPAVIIKDPGRGGETGDAARALPLGDFQGDLPLNDLLLPFLAFRKGRPLGVWGRGLTRP